MTIAKLGKALTKGKINPKFQKELIESTVEQGGNLSKIKLRPGRISNVEKGDILEYIGQEATRRYKRNLFETGYKGDVFKEAFFFSPDQFGIDNYYWLDAGSKRLNEILRYLEYGTGLYGPLKKSIQSKKISYKTGNLVLLKFKIEESFIYTRSVKGIKPGYMFTKAVESVRNERSRLQREYRVKAQIMGK